MPIILALAMLAGCLEPAKDGADSGATSEPDIDVSPTALDFGAVFQLSESSASFTVTNVGDADLDVELALGAGAPFSLGSASLSLGAGDSADVEVGLNPEDFGAFSDTITIESNDPDEPVIIVTLSASVDADVDGDGFGPDQDCDDEDPDAYPGNTETWYDGVDGDCEGDDDYDADADGYQSDDYAGDDCDDSDADVYPGAEETWYDGVDQNCDGRNDDDADGDGYEYPSEDCDDANAEVNPGTLEVPDDGVDNDCDSEVDEDLSADDVDGDGYSELDGDCNDGDASISPDATEGWYDGVDSDCSGGSDYDADLDGEDSDAYGGDDCDDADASVNTSAAEAYYDGVDANCDGLSDYDADADGHDSDAYGGDDCNDLNSAVSPSATETWYDGVDSDCAGDNDYDADGDGYDSDAHGGDDCDDTTAAAYPGGSDTWYDGVDGDCAGDSDYDADLDGYDSDAYGGDDCDDADGAINADADEYCDGVDTDCSGAVDDDYALDAATWYADSDADGYGDLNSSTGACDQPSGYVADDTDCDDTDGAAYPGAAEIAYDMLDNDCDGVPDDMLVGSEFVYAVYGDSVHEAMASAMVMSPDLNGDGDAELIMGSTGNDQGGTDSGAVSFIDADGISTNSVITDGYSFVYGGAASDYFGQSIVLLGDVDADGNDEVAVSAPYADPGNTNAGAVYIFDLGTGATHASGTVAISGDGEMQGNASSDHLGSSLATGDIDGDGILDLVIGADGGSGGRGEVYVHTASDGYTAVTNLARFYSTVYLIGPSLTAGLGTAVSLEADLTGNGYSDLVSCGGFNNSNAGRCWLLEGSATLSISGRPIQDYDFASIGGQASEELGMSRDGLRTADVDGDGTADLLVSSVTANSGDGAVYVFFGGTGLSGNYTTGADEDINIAGDGALGTAINVGDDIDGDGNADLLIGAPTAGASAEGSVYLFVGPMSAGSYTAPADASASWTGIAADDLFGSALSNAMDFDGDGTTEFAVSAPGDDSINTDKGGVYVVPTY